MMHEGCVPEFPGSSFGGGVEAGDPVIGPLQGVRRFADFMRDHVRAWQ